MVGDRRDPDLPANRTRGGCAGYGLAEADDRNRAREKALRKEGWCLTFGFACGVPGSPRVGVKVIAALAPHPELQRPLAVECDRGC